MSVRINLLPEELLRPRISWTNVMTWVLLLAVVASAGATIYWQRSRLALYREWLAQVRDEVAQRSAAAEKVNEVRAAGRALDELLEQGRTPLRDGYIGVPVLAEIKRRLPEGVWFTELTIGSGGAVTAGGGARSPAAVTDLLRSLKASPLFDAVRLTGVSVTYEEGRRRRVDFSVSWHLKGAGGSAGPGR